MSGSLYICIKQFNARLGDELSLKVGDKIEVLSDDSEYNDGWYMGKNLLTTDVGLYPKSFTQILKQQDTPLLRSRSRNVSANNSSTTLPTVNSQGSQAERGITISSSPHGTTPLQPSVGDVSSSLKNMSFRNGDADATTYPLNSTSETGPVDSETTKRYSTAIPSSGSRVSHTTSTLNEIDSVLKEINDNPYAKKSGFVEDAPSPSFAPRNDNSSVPVRQKSSSTIRSGTSGINSTHFQQDSPNTTSDSLNAARAPESISPDTSSNADAPPVSYKGASVNDANDALLPSNALSWTPEQVASHFTRLHFDKDVTEKFTKHQITGEILFELDLAHLKELEIDRFGTRFQIYKEIENLKNLSQKSAQQDSSNDSFSNNRDITPNRAISRSTEELPKKQVPTEEQAGLMPSASIYRKGHERRRSNSMTDLNGLYKFGEGSQETPSTKMAHSARPSSSVYEPSVYSGNHQRGFSGSKTPTHHRRQSSTTAGIGVYDHHRRHSSMFSFMSGNEDSKGKALEKPATKSPIKSTDKPQETMKINTNRPSTLMSPTKDKKRQSGFFSPQKIKSTFNSPDTSNSEFDVRSSSPRNLFGKDEESRESDKAIEEKRIGSDSSAISRLKTLRTTSTQNFKNLTSSKKGKTSAFQEGIQEISPDEAIKTASYSGWMSKRSGNTLSWRSRYFTLHGTRLSYFTSLKDKKEKGLIDITAHKVMPAEQDSSTNNDKYIALYASSTGSGRYCFKIVPPAPGFKKGLTFTQPKTHYFAVDTQDEMRGWMKALMTATIDIDDSVPVVSSCSTPTVSLSKAQELLAKAREETKMKDDELRSKGFIRDGYEPDTLLQPPQEFSSFMSNDIQSSPISTSSNDDTTISSPSRSSRPALTVDSNLNKGNYGKSPTTPSLPTMQGGFASPYLLASGLLSPRSGGISSPMDTPSSNRDNLNENETLSQEYQELHDSSAENSPAYNSTRTQFSNSTGRVVSGRKKSIGDRMLSYSSDASGNLTFQIKQKK
jgi:hypothetical protein